MDQTPNRHSRSGDSSSRKSTFTRRPHSPARGGFSRGSSSTGARSSTLYTKSASHASSSGSNYQKDRAGTSRTAHTRPSTGGYARGAHSAAGTHARPSAHRGGSSFSHRPHGGNARGGFSRGSSGGGRGGGRKMPTFNPSQFINKNPVDTAEVEYTAKHTFNDFGLDAALAKTIIDSGITIPSPIQDQIIPHILNGHDVIGLAETGTGKTAAFLVPLIQKTLKENGRQTLILTPTRELALQIDAELKKLSAGFKLFSTICVGGTNIRPQIMGLKRKNHFVIGTPGRVLDLIDRRHFRPQGVKTVVLDEADRMLDMGFIHDMRKILEDVPADRETLFFSATMSKDIERLVHDFLKDPVIISVKKKDVTNSVLQDVVKYAHHNKFDTLVSLLKTPACKRVIIFGSMKHSVEKLSKELNTAGIHADSIHGNKSHGQRQQALKRFKSGNAQVLVATDVAARGIHVDSVTHVINYDLPNTFEDYVHRIGRTGRGSEKGIALTFVQE